jgi:hypothetical protein
MASTA